jgi:hypothetical protein
VSEDDDIIRSEDIPSSAKNDDGEDQNAGEDVVAALTEKLKALEEEKKKRETEIMRLKH